MHNVETWNLTDLEIEFAYRALAIYRDLPEFVQVRSEDSQNLVRSLTSKFARASRVGDQIGIAAQTFRRLTSTLTAGPS